MSDWPLIVTMPSISNPREMAVWIKPNCAHCEAPGWEAIETGLPDPCVKSDLVTECLVRFRDLELKGWLLEDSYSHKHFVNEPTYRRILGNNNWDLKMKDDGYYKLNGKNSMELVSFKVKQSHYEYFEWIEETVKYKM